MSAWLPKDARLRNASLRAGDCRLEFTLPAAAESGPGRVTLAVFSLAHQILHNRPLKTWALEDLAQVRDHPGGTWEESDHQATWRVHSLKLGRKSTCETCIRHDPVANRIHWTHVEHPSKNGQP